ncbi:MAG TPA: pyridoxamine 5'-phosphate oxidase family protein [Candidatus Eisenbacteria bacterium]|nr:pyridoxamine 5'-phosphate oxidase family protein [Candidatus Eisenbacteria bacterium]
MTKRFHPGEIAVQERVGVRYGAEKVGRGIDDEVPPAAAHFLAQRYSLYVGSLDAAARPWASQLVGPPGFVTTVDPRTVRIDAAPAPGDPLGENLRANAQVGLLAIDLVTRRRYRVNGTATIAPGGSIEVAVVQALGNCPKYIQVREPVGVSEAQSDASRVTRTATLSAAQRTRIERADTFFLATASPDAGTDVSHRGGRPGFVRTIDERTLLWPDYQGNMMFMSLGNIEAYPHAGALFVDFENGDVLQMTGTATIDWDPERARTFPCAQRVIELRVDDVIDAPGASPLRWRLVEPSPANP